MSAARFEQGCPALTAMVPAVDGLSAAEASHPRAPSSSQAEQWRLGTTADA